VETRETCLVDMWAQVLSNEPTDFAHRRAFHSDEKTFSNSAAVLKLNCLNLPHPRLIDLRGHEMFDQLVNATFLYPIVIILFVGAAEVGALLGRKPRETSEKSEYMTTLTASSLGLLALLLAFSLSHALSRYEARRALILDEANAIESTANFASMLPKQAQAEILSLLREYVAVRIGFRRPYDPAKLDRDVAKSRELLTKLWQQAVAVSEPQSLPANRFINSLDEMTKIQERRLISAGYYVPNAILLMLIGLAIVAIGFTGYQSGLTQSRLHAPTLIMAVTLAVVIVLVIDLDQPVRGFIRVPIKALIDVAKNIQP